MKLTADTRYSSTAQFLRGAAIFAHHAHSIKNILGTPSQEEVVEHRSYVVGAVLQAVAALESEVSEIVLHGPGHHLGSNGADVQARERLSAEWPALDRMTTREKYDKGTQIFGKGPIHWGVRPYQSAALLIKLRNEIIHYKSKWGTRWPALDDACGPRRRNIRTSKNSSTGPRLFLPMQTIFRITA